MVAIAIGVVLLLDVVEAGWSTLPSPYMLGQILRY